MNMPLPMQPLIDTFVSWAESQEPIRAAFIVGSRARTDRPADDWSDLDLAVVVTDPAPFLTTTDWLANIAAPHLTFLEPTAVGGQLERRVLFEGSRDVDFAFVPVSMIADLNRQGLPDGDGVTLLLQRGAKLLFDKDGDVRTLLASVPPRPAPHVAPPSEAVFTELINDVLYHLVWCAKKAKRGELWYATLACNGDMKHRLLRMIEWHTQVRHQWRLDTWHQGRFLEAWADPEIVKVLPATFAMYDACDVQRALKATLDLFHDLATTVARDLCFPYPEAAHAYVDQWLEPSAFSKPPV
jgi:aminoglycoside 6-adenylyltransferase